ncbi:Gfo/Idh/MocA family protein [Paracoccus saliphilus]|uniref:Gfo/Idh/MocA family oxidoreductase n=1 Tax=Paracoccus saliphilus TaxID=405559 RepID=A0AA45W520_9RHOB|nr:Gfo/Idh/MocA family oxidoreductase [Paracoccus saliphilus]WCR02126.1 Gfo/Idh/MocA family oxidoreductase [Paracoccus saliphilus]SIS90286.1 Predicted dehydrogenase [Paracoccus saliphilus]
MSAARVTTGIVGLGRWGRNLVTSGQGGPLCFTHAATRTPAKATEFCIEQGLDLRPALADILDDVEAVVLATPHSQHGAQVRAAAAARRHVFVEKPLALNVEDAASAFDACTAAGVQLAVGFNRRHLPGYQALCARVQGGAIGRPLHVEGSFCGPFGYDYSDEMWRGSSDENPAGGMAAMGIHILDAMIAVMGRIARVSVLSRRLAVSSQLDDTTTVHLDFASGATGTLSTLMASAPFWRLHVFGSEGWAQMPDQTRLLTSNLAGECTEQSFAPVDTLAAELASFAAAMRRSEDYPVTREQALAGVATMEAIGRSATWQGAWVEVPALPPSASLDRSGTPT